MVIAVAVGLKDMTTIKCYECGAYVWPKHGELIGCFCMERMLHFCYHCKFLERPSALTTLIDVMEREAPLLYMGRRERKIAPNKSKIDIAQDKMCQRIRSRVEVMKIMRPLTAEERRTAPNVVPESIKGGIPFYHHQQV